MPPFTKYLYDVFVSYACVDDQADDGQLGWVSGFVQDLGRRLSERLGRKDNFTIWQDRQQLAAHVDLERQINDAITSSACLLVVMSPGYLQSDWCKKEREYFLKWIHDRHECGGCIFVTERDWIHEFEKPAALRNLLGFPFWTGKPRDQSALPRPLDRERESDRDEYKDQLNAVALAIESELGRLIKTSLPPNKQERSPKTGPEGATVFLAEVTDDLRPQCKKMRSALIQRGLNIVSGGRSPEAPELERSVGAALEEAQLFVQLLSQVPGMPLPDSKETYPLLQYRLAVKSKKRILQWRSPQITEELFDSLEVEDPELAAEHRTLLFSMARAEPIEDFNKRIFELLTEEPRVAATSASAGAEMVFVSFKLNSSDEPLANDLCDYLGRKGFGVVRPTTADDAQPTEIREDFEHSVLKSRGWIVVYGDQRSKLWARGQVNEINQLLCEHRHQGGVIHLCAGPPAPKAVDSPLKLIGMHLPQMQVIDCQAGFAADKFDLVLGGFRPRQPR